MPLNAIRSTISEPCNLTPRQLQELPDEELMAHLRSGHDDALAILFDRYHRLVLAIASRIVRDRAESEDVMQTVFLDIHRAAAQFDNSKGSTKVWILQYAYHRAINRRRQLSRQHIYNQPDVRDSSNPTAVAVSANALAPQECTVLVHEALATLNKAQKTALELAYFNGLTMEEIAHKTGERVSNVRHHFYRGLDKLRSCLGIKPKKVRVAQEEIARVEQ